MSQTFYEIQLVKTLWTMLANENCFVYDDKNKFDLNFNVTNGLQQGTVSAPITFNIYTADLPSFFGFASNPPMNITCFADDFFIQRLKS